MLSTVGSYAAIDGSVSRESVGKVIQGSGGPHTLWNCVLLSYVFL